MDGVTKKSKEPRRFRGRVKVATLAIALLVAIVVICQRLSESDAKRLADATESLRFRPSDARLSGDYPYRPVAPRLRGEMKAMEARSSETFLAAAARIENDFAEDASLDRLQALSAVLLYLGDTEKAVTNLEDALRRSEASTPSHEREAALWNDLAVAYLQTAENSDERRSLVIALDAVENAYAMERESLPIAWTRALLLEKTNQRHAAADAWNEYLRLDPASLCDRPWGPPFALIEHSGTSTLEGRPSV
jgi:tetratricopeptide (TPR) repeat protein